MPPEQGLAIRPLVPGDKTAWKTLWRTFVADVGERVSDAEVERAWATLMDETAALHGLAATMDGALAGFVVYAPIPYPWGSGKACYLVDIGVAVAYRRRGVARALIEALAERGRTERWRHIFWLAQPENQGARRLYDSLARQSDLVRYDLMLTPDDPAPS
jgi:ribosomal protein S18 acetylase RimI-like enzyme